MHKDLFHKKIDLWHSAVYATVCHFTVFPTYFTGLARSVNQLPTKCSWEITIRHQFVTPPFWSGRCSAAEPTPPGQGRCLSVEINKEAQLRDHSFHGARLMFDPSSYRLQKSQRNKWSLPTERWVIGWRRDSERNETGWQAEETCADLTQVKRIRAKRKFSTTNSPS